MIDLLVTNSLWFPSSENALILKDIFIRCRICSYFCLALEKCCAAFFRPLWFRMRNPLSFEMVFSNKQCIISLCCFQDFFLSLDKIFSCFLLFLPDGSLNSRSGDKWHTEGSRGRAYEDGIIYRDVGKDRGIHRGWWITQGFGEGKLLLSLT